MKPRYFNGILIKFDNHLRWAAVIIWCRVWCHFVCFQFYAVASMSEHLFHILWKPKYFIKTLRQLILCFILNNSLDQRYSLHRLVHKDFTPSSLKQTTFTVKHTILLNSPNSYYYRECAWDCRAIASTILHQLK